MIRITTHQLPRIRHARQTSATPDTRGLQPNRLRATCIDRIDCMPPSVSTLSGSTMRAAAHTGGIPETPRMPSAAPHVCACGGRALSCEAACGATGERVLATPVSRRLSERPSPRRRRAGQPRRVGRGGCLRGIARRAAGSRQKEMWGLLVFRAAHSRAGLGAGDLSVLAEGPQFEDGR